MVRKTVKKILSACHTPTWLFILLFIVLILRIPSFFEPYSYGDEMIYLSLGEAIRQGIPLYKGIHDNKPPLLYIVAGISGSLFWFRAILAIWHLLTVYLFWKLSCVLFPKKERLQKIATIVFSIFTTLPLLEGNIANAELFMIGPIIAAFILLFSKKLTKKKLLLSGFFFSIAALFKVPAAFDLPAIIFFWIVTATKLSKNNIKKIAINSLYLILGFSIPILLSILWYAMRGAFGEYVVAAFLQNVGYLSTWRPDDVQKPFLVKNAPLIFRALVVSTGLGILYLKRKRLSKPFIFLTAWLLLTLFAVTLSERPYPHYLLQSIAPVSLLAAMFFTLKNMEQILVMIPLALFFLTPVYYKFWSYPTVSYYTRFLKFSTNKITTKEYFRSFGDATLRNYQIADFIASSSRRDEKVFVWGNSSVIYALSRRLPPGRYVADYHIMDFSSPKETIDTLATSMPKIIVILPDSPPFFDLEVFLRKNYILVEEIDGAQIWTVLSPQVRALMSP